MPSLCTYVAILHTELGGHIPVSFQSEQDPRFVCDPKNHEAVLQAINLKKGANDRFKVYVPFLYGHPIAIGL